MQYNIKNNFEFTTENMKFYEGNLLSVSWVAVEYLFKLF